MPPLQRRLGLALALAGLAFVLVATLMPVDDPSRAAATTPLLCLICGEHGGADVVVNLFLFLPFAVGLRLYGETWTRTVLAVFLISFSVELLQYWLVPGRDTSFSDLLTNTASGAIGATIGTVLPRWVFPDPARAMSLAVAWAGIVLLVLGIWAWLLEPDVPDGRLLSRWAHEAQGGMPSRAGFGRCIWMACPCLRTGILPIRPRSGGGSSAAAFPWTLRSSRAGRCPPGCGSTCFGCHHAAC